MTSNKSGSHGMDTDAVGVVADDFYALSEAIGGAVTFAEGGEVTPEHFGKFPAIEDAANTVLGAKGRLAQSLAGLAGFTSQTSQNVDQAAKITRYSDESASADYSSHEKSLEK